MPGEVADIDFLATAGKAAAIPVILSAGVPRPASATSGCDADCGATTPSSCTSINQPASFPPTNCASCCGTCGFFGTSCPTCPGDCATCFCMRSINVVGGAGGSCAGGDTQAVSMQQSCVKDFDPLCGAFPGVCQRDCNAARAVAVANGISQYACCFNCT
ncbi:MAG: hypothetical protein AB7S38_12760 [Vulcanimicrobiota bacterium]